MEYLIRGGQYASCIHAGGLSCNYFNHSTVKVKKAVSHSIQTYLLQEDCSTG